MIKPKRINFAHLIVQTCALILLYSTQIALADNATSTSKNMTVKSMKDFDLNRYLGR